MQDIVKINQNDNVAVALRPLNKGEVLQTAETRNSVRHFPMRTLAEK